MSANRKENRQIKFRVSEQEFDRLEAIAESHQMSVPAFTKKRVISYRMPPLKIDRTGAIEIAKQLRAIGNNVNQLTRRANENETMEPGEIQAVQKELHKIWQQLSEALQSQQAN